MRWWEVALISAGVSAVIWVGGHFITLHLAVKASTREVTGMTRGKPGRHFVGQSAAGTVATSTAPAASPAVTAGAIIASQGAKAATQKV